MLAACMGALLSAVGDRGGGGHGDSHGVRSCFQVTRDRDCGGRAKAAVRPDLPLGYVAANGNNGSLSGSSPDWPVARGEREGRSGREARKGAPAGRQGLTAIV